MTATMRKAGRLVTRLWLLAVLMAGCGSSVPGGPGGSPAGPAVPGDVVVVRCRVAAVDGVATPVPQPASITIREGQVVTFRGFVETTAGLRSPYTFEWFESFGGSQFTANGTLVGRQTVGTAENLIQHIFAPNAGAATMWVVVTTGNGAEGEDSCSVTIQRSGPPAL